ncbi:MAG: hypothetical protein ABEJ03_03845 [Candidatus Nanohaloarchaea archaeon]
MGFEEELVQHTRGLAEDRWIGVLADAVSRHTNTGDQTKDLTEIEKFSDLPVDEDELIDWLNRKRGKRRKLAKILSTCYYHEEWDEEPDVMLLMETPGSLTDREDSRHQEAERLLDVDSVKEEVKIYRKFSHGWLGKNLRDNFTEPFLDKLQDKGVISNIDDLESYIPEERGDFDGGESPFFKDFYVTDVVSSRISGGQINAERRDKGMEIVVQEISKIDPNVVFCFGTKPWKAIRRNAEVEPVSDEYGVESGITSVHGGLYKADFEAEMDFEPELVDQISASEVYVIPLAHMSRAKNYIRDSYTCYMDNGLDELDL